MPSVTWDATFESLPADVDEAKYGATKIRQLKLAVSERLELEMNFKTGTQPLGKAGKISSFFYGTAAEIAALTGMSKYAVAYDTDNKQVKYYTGANWVACELFSTPGAGTDPFPQYLKLDKAGQTIAENVAVTATKTIDGRDISVDGTALDAIPAQIAAIKLGTWSTKAEDTVYQAITDGFVIAVVVNTIWYNTATLKGYTDGSNPPTTLRCGCRIPYDAIAVGSITMPVRKNDYWKVVKSDISGTPTVTVNWIPFGA